MTVLISSYKVGETSEAGTTCEDGLWVKGADGTVPEGGVPPLVSDWFVLA